MVLFSFLICLKQDYFDCFSSFKFFSVLFSSFFSFQKWQFWCLAYIWTKGSLGYSLILLINHGGDFRTAPATPGLVNIYLYQCHHLKLFGLITYFILIFFLCLYCLFYLKKNLNKVTKVPTKRISKGLMILVLPWPLIHYIMWLSYIITYK